MCLCLSYVIIVKPEKLQINLLIFYIIYIINMLRIKRWQIRNNHNGKKKIIILHYSEALASTLSYDSIPLQTVIVS